MPQELVITPRIDSDQIDFFDKQAQQLDLMLEDYSQPIAQTGILENFGSRLWECAGLDHEEILDAIEDAKDDEEPLHLIVKGEEFYHLPWELIYHQHPEIGFLGRNPWCVVVRRVRGRGKKAPQAAARPLRILLFVSAPEDLDPEQSRLDFEKEEELLFTALDEPLSKGEIDIDVAEDGFLKTLVSRLEKKHYHAVILSMHGTPAKNKKGENEWGLLFEDENTWQSAPIAGSDFVAKLESLPKGHRPGLVVLSACRSAKAEKTAKSISDVAKKLHESGFERILGMRLSVMDSAASCFSTELFRKLALGEMLGRAVNLARDEVAKGAWLSSGKDGTHGDLFGQWTLPVLLDRTADGPMIDTSAKNEVIERPPLPSVMIDGSSKISLPSRSSFIGRRAEIREHLRSFLEKKSRCIIFTGPGGVGKTTLAGLFVRNLVERQPETRVLGFQAPFDFDRIYEPLREQAFDGSEEPTLIDAIGKEPDIRERIRRMLLSLSKRKCPCAFLLDNLESIQEVESLEISDEHADSLWFLKTICELSHPTQVLLTGRYSLAGLPDEVVACPVKDAPYGDVLHRMKRLEWPQSMRDEKKRVYKILGGNHRAIEWTAGLVTGGKAEADELVAALEKIEAPPQTPEESIKVVVEAMRQNMLFEKLREQLTDEQDRLLQAVSLYRVPVNEDGLLTVELEQANHEANRKCLLDYALLEAVYDRSLELEYFFVPPVVKEFLGEEGFSEEELKSLHGVMGSYHKFQVDYLSQSLSDGVEGIHHFRLADMHEQADELAREVCNHYYRNSNFSDANKLAEEVMERHEPPTPCWALNIYGICQLTFGFLDNALDAFERALSIASDKKEKSTTLNNISQVYNVRGDYETTLSYLKESLKISKEIGDKSEEAPVLNNISGIYQARGDYETALGYLKDSLEISKEIGNKFEEGIALNNISQVFNARGHYETALIYLKESLKISKEIGDKSGESTALTNMSITAIMRGDYETALTYLKESLRISREIGDKNNEAQVLHNISQVFNARGDYETALSYLKASFKIRREIGDTSGKSTSLNNMATTAQARGDYETALSYLKESLKISKEIGNKLGEGTTLNNISQIYDSQGDYETALSYLKKSLKIRREIGDKLGEGTTLNNIGQIFKARKDYEKALSYLKDSLKIIRAIGDKENEAGSLNNISHIYSSRGDYETALSYLKESLKISREIGNKSVIASSLHNTASIALQTGDINQAISLFSEAFSLAMETQNALGLFNTARDFGYVLAINGDKEKGRELLNMALEVGRASKLAGVELVEELLRKVG
ncbi:Tetratricopeptide repeat protein [Candidatus Magnetomoraceae bacterium gMMP-15]